MSSLHYCWKGAEGARLCHIKIILYDSIQELTTKLTTGFFLIHPLLCAANPFNVFTVNIRQISHLNPGRKIEVNFVERY